MSGFANGVNHAANLPAIDNQDLQNLIGSRLSDYVVAQYRRTLPLYMVLDIATDVDLCNTISYMIEDHSDLPTMSDSALNTSKKRKTLAPPKIKTFSGFCKGGFETKLSVEQLECINQSEILRKWYNTQLATAMEDGRNAIMARFYRHMLTNAHPKNTGLNAGLTTGGQKVGSPTNPIRFNPDNSDKALMSMLNVIKQMPRARSVDNEFGVSAEDGYFFGPQGIETILMQNANYNSWDVVGECASCALFKDVFTHKPRGLMPITSFCVERRVCVSGGEQKTIYPVLFGKRFHGTKASLRIKTNNYMSNDKQSVFYSTDYYWHIHTFDNRFTGVAWWCLEEDQPETMAGCD